MTAYCDRPVVLKLSIAGGASLDLMDGALGFRLESLDLGYPAVREDSNVLPARHGMADYTRWFGERAVTITGALVPSSAGGSRQKAWHALAPFLDPAARPVLTYQVDADVSPRTMTLRAALLTGPFAHRAVSKVALGFKAADPLAYDATQRQAIAYPGGAAGRVYNLVPNRRYPAGGSSVANCFNYGDFDALPVVRIYGPITDPLVMFTPTTGAAGSFMQMPGYVIGGGHYVELDSTRRSAYLDGDPAQSVLSYVKPPAGGWPRIIPGAPSAFTYLQLAGTGYGAQTQVIASWADPYLL